MKKIFLFVTLCLSRITIAQIFENNFEVPNNPIVYALASNSSYVFAGTDGGGIYRTADKGESWQLISGSSGDTYFYSLLSAHDSLYAGGRGAVYFSANNGTSWTNLNSSFNTNDNILAIAKNSQYVFVGIKQKGVYMRAVGSGGWSAKNAGLHTSATVNDLLFVGSALYAATDQGLYVSSNNGTSWQALNSGIPSTVQVNKLFMHNNIILAGTNNGFYKSTSAGNSWVYGGDGSSPVMPNVISFGFLGGTYFGGVVASNIHGLFLSNNSGDSWKSYSASAIAAMPFYALTSTADYVFAGNAGYISRYSSPPLGIKNNNKNNFDLNIYPNPCSDWLIVATQQMSEPLQVTVFNQQGCKIMTASLEKNETEINVSTLAPGLYFATFKNSVGIKTIKFIKD